MTERFHINARPDPTLSLLGLACRRVWTDSLQAEARFWLVAIGLITLTAIAHMLAWGLLHSQAAASPDLFISVQAGVWLVVIAGTFVGVCPSVRVDIGDDGHVSVSRRKRCVLALSAAELVGGKVVPAREYHRHYRRYAATRSFPGRSGDPIVLLATTAGPVALGIQVAEHRRFLDRLDETRAVHVRVA